MLSIAKGVSDGMKVNPTGMEETIRLITELRLDVEAVMVLDRDGTPLAGVQGGGFKEDTRIYQQEWCDVQRLYQEGYVFSMPHVQTLYQGKYDWVVTLLYLTNWTDDAGVRQYGCVLVDTSFSSLGEICSRAVYDNSGLVYITDRYGNLVYHPTQQLVFLGLKEETPTTFVGVPDSGMIGLYNGRRCAYSVCTLEQVGWRIVRVDYLKSAMSFDANMQQDLLVALAAIILCVIAVAFLVSYVISHPIQRLTAIVQEVQSRDFHSVNTSAFRFPRETWELAYAFDRMLSRISGLLGQIEQEQMQLRRSEIRALRAQINPHFLYNTLDSIVWMAEAGQTKEVTVMTTALADFFRLSISDSRDYITLGEEFRYAESYLIIQEMRFQDKFDYFIECQPGIENLLVTKILLQPLIENAIYHGVEKYPDKGTIRVSARIEDGRLLLEVRDDGCGMSRKTLENILLSDPSRKSGIGVKNVHQRIRLLFGEEYGLSFESELEVGTTARIWLPVLRQEESL